MLSFGIFAALHFKSTIRSRGFIPGSAPPNLAAMLISLLNLEKILPRLASRAPLKCLTFAHLLCPAINVDKLVDGYSQRRNGVARQQFKTDVAGYRFAAWRRRFVAANNHQPVYQRLW